MPSEMSSAGRGTVSSTYERTGAWSEVRTLALVTSVYSMVVALMSLRLTRQRMRSVYLIRRVRGVRGAGCGLEDAGCGVRGEGCGVRGAG